MDWEVKSPNVEQKENSDYNNDQFTNQGEEVGPCDISR